MRKNRALSEQHPETSWYLSGSAWVTYQFKNFRFSRSFIILFFTATLIFCSVLKPSPAGTYPKTWLQWHGPRRDNISKEKGLLKKWPKQGPKLLWTASGCGKGYSSVTISKKMIYTAGTINNQTYVLAFDLKGKLIWKRANGKKWEASAMMFWARNYDGSRATPTVNDGVVYHLNELGRLAALNEKTGSEIWSINIKEKFDAELPHYGYSESLLIDGKGIICMPGGSKGYITALDKKTGKTIWANRTINDTAAYCSPILVEDKGVRQIITFSKKNVLGVDADTGELLWQYEHINKRKLNISTPVYSAGLVCASSGYGGGTIMLKLNYKGKKISVKQVGKNKYMDNHHGGILLLNNFIYGTGHNKKGFYCLDFKTGKEIYREINGGKGAFLYADGMFYFLDEKGTMKLIRPSSKKYDLISQFKVPENGKRLYWAHPVVNDGKLYIRYDDNIFVYDVKK